MAGINDPKGVPYMDEGEMAQEEATSSLSAVLPWGGKYPPGVGVAKRDGLDIVTPGGQKLRDMHQRILSYSVGGHAGEVDNAVDEARQRFPRATLVDTTEYFEPATLLMKDLHEALGPHGDYLIQLAATGTGANEQAIRLAMGSLGGQKSSKLVVLGDNYGGAGLYMNSVCEAAGWKGGTSLESNAEVVNLDGSNMDEIFARIAKNGEKPILIMEDGVQGVGGFRVLDEKFLRELAERVSDAGGRKIYDNVQTFVRATGGKGLFGFNRWTDPKNPKHLPDFVTFAKGIGDGQAMAGLAVSRFVAEQVKAAPGGAGNTFDTFNRGRDALTTARKVLEISQREKLWENMHNRGIQFQKNLRPMVD
ncbi:MAG: aminotransferase class III-fold pyridoxal phosphate-dependent enzyme [Candidatus Roizmanbacteria bacterium]|nr:aminotransferase class III-fold pyridoxal phosphate-dependent enzyme [Candidatus Roizmanbacteria bacterium]